MTVAELIAKLQEMPQDMEVMTDGYEGGVGDLGAPCIVEISIDANVYEGRHALFGRHSIIKYANGYPEYEHRNVVYMERPEHTND